MDGWMDGWHRKHVISPWLVSPFSNGCLDSAVARQEGANGQHSSQSPVEQ